MKVKLSSISSWLSWFVGFPGGSDGKESACSAGDLQWGWEDPLEEEMAARSSILAWRIPRTEEPGGWIVAWLQSMGSLRVRDDWVTSVSLFTFMPCRRKWQPTPVFLPGESQGWGSLVGCCLWGRTESDMTEVTWQQQQQQYIDSQASNYRQAISETPVHCRC